MLQFLILLFGRLGNLRLPGSRRTGRASRPEWRGVIAVFVAVAMVVAACAIVIQSFLLFERLLARRDAANRSLDAVWNMAFTMDQNEQAYRHYFLTRDPQDLALWQQGAGQVRVSLQNLKSALGPSAERSGVPQLERFLAEREAATQELIRIRQNQGLAAATSAVVLNFTKLASVQARQILWQIETEEQSYIQRTGPEIHAHLMRALAVGLLGLALLLVVMIWTYLHLRSNDLFVESLRQDIVAADDRYRRLSAKHQEQQEAAAAAVARAVHDQLGQALVAIKLDADAASRWIGTEPSQAVPFLNRIRATADSTADMARNIALELRPAILDLCGIATALEWLAREFQIRSSMRITVHADPEAQHPLSPSEQTAMFRIAQEALTNIVRHAHATVVSLGLARQDGNIVLTIDDDGVGIPHEKFTDPHSLGLLGMKERAEILGAGLEIANAPRGGARIRLILPERAAMPSV